MLAKKHNLSPEKAAAVLNVNLDKNAGQSKKGLNMDHSGPTIIHNINITSNNIYGHRSGSELLLKKTNPNHRLPTTQSIINE